MWPPGSEQPVYLALPAQRSSLLAIHNNLVQNNRFIDASGLHRSDITLRYEAKRHSRCCWIVCTLFNEHGWGLDHTKLRGSGRTTKWNSIAQGHRRGHGLDTRCAPVRTDLPESWHNTPGQYIECTCKLTTNISMMTDNIMIINQVKSMQEILQMQCKQNVHRVTRTRLPDGYLVTKR